MPSFRGVEIVPPPQWTRGITEHVEYTGLPLKPPPAPKLNKAGVRKQQQADARLAEIRAKVADRPFLFQRQSADANALRAKQAQYHNFQP